MRTITIVTLHSLLLVPGLLFAEPPEKSKIVDANVVNEPTVHMGSSVDVNAYQAGEWNLSVGEAARDLREFTGNFEAGDGWVEIYQVPDGRRFVLTDIYFNQRIFGSWLNTISLNRNPAENVCGIGSDTFMFTHLLGLDAGERNQVHFPLQSGYEFTAGERICVAQSGGGLIFYNLSGFETSG